jgi:dihydrofolate reductase
MAGLVRVFVGVSIDGFLAGEGDDLSWLPAPDPGGSDNGFGAFLESIGALLLGRRTYDVVEGLGGEWPYGERPLLVATRRPLAPKVATARAVEAPIARLVELAKEAAEGRDVYVDGGELIRQALDADLVDTVTLTLVPVVLGRGHPLFAGATRRHRLALESSTRLPGGLVQLAYRVAR